MKITLLEDAVTALDKLNKGKQLSEKDLTGLSADELVSLIDSKKLFGRNEVLVNEAFLKSFFGDRYDEATTCLSLLMQSVDNLGADISNNLFLYYVDELTKLGITPSQTYASLIYNFIKSKKLTKQDMTWLLDKSLYQESDAKDIQYIIETLLFLKKQGGAKEYNLRVKEDDGKYRFLKVDDLYDSGKILPAAEIRDLLVQAQQTGDEEKDSKDSKASLKADKEDAEKELTQAQEKLVKKVISQMMQKFPKSNSYDLGNTVRSLFVEGDTEDSLSKKVSKYIKDKGSLDSTGVKKTKLTDKKEKRLYSALVAAGYNAEKVTAVLSSNLYDSSQPLGNAFNQLAGLLDKM